MADKSYTQLQNELNDILLQLQSGDTAIDDALKLHKKGQALIKQLEKQLNQAENEVRKIEKRS